MPSGCLGNSYPLDSCPQDAYLLIYSGTSHQVLPKAKVGQLCNWAVRVQRELQEEVLRQQCPPSVSDQVAELDSHDDLWDEQESVRREGNLLSYGSWDY